MNASKWRLRKNTGHAPISSDTRTNTLGLALECLVSPSGVRNQSPRHAYKVTLSFGQPGFCFIRVGNSANTNHRNGQPIFDFAGCLQLEPVSFGRGGVDQHPVDIGAVTERYVIN